jgi:phosphoglycerol transferase MdoB-like AlkP superfamily enzyme
VREWRWFSSSQPQTLQIAVVLLYVNAVFGVLGGLLGGLSLLLLVFALGQGASALGIANERRWGYRSGVVFAVLPLLLILVTFVVSHVFAVSLFNLVFEIALLVALLHDQSRAYYKLWFQKGSGLPSRRYGR